LGAASYILGMFIRKNKTRSGSYSIQVIQKKGRNNKVLKSFGSARSKKDIDDLVRQAQKYISDHQGTQSLFSYPSDVIVEDFVNALSIDQLQIVGPQLILGGLYDDMGLNGIDPEGYFKHLVLCRVTYPGSKLKTVEYLTKHHNTQVSVHTIYRYMDKLKHQYKSLIETAIFNHTKKVLPDKMKVVFYDMTTLYFESESEDDLRKIGYSKDGKHQHPQIMVGLLVSTNGYPVAYEIFEGNTAETKTLIPFLEAIQNRFVLEKPIIIADSALLSKKNLEELKSKDYEYILGGRIKNEAQETKQVILQVEIDESSPHEIEHLHGRLIVSYSSKRAAKDAYNRKRGLSKLEEKVKNGKLNKSAINNRGYNKYLQLSGKLKVEIDYNKYNTDQAWDGLKGYITNTKLSRIEVLEAYGNLWQVEKAFRISKTDLRFRPIFHRLRKRIESHICICFTAYAVFKELERKIDETKLGISPNKAIEHIKQIQQLNYKLPESKIWKSKILNPNQGQYKLLNLMKN
jgi:transposase